MLADVDLVISTGAIGYVGAPTFVRILEAAGRRPWLALFALRMFSFDAIAEALKEHGYAVFKLDGKTFRQRHFADGKERAEVFANLDALGIDPGGCESDGWYHAEFFFAHPADEDVAAAAARPRQALIRKRRRRQRPLTVSPALASIMRRQSRGRLAWRAATAMT